MKYLPYYSFIEKKGPVSFFIKSQLDGSINKAYAGDIRLANIDDWQISKDANNRRLRDAAYVISPQPSDSETESDSDPEENVPLSKLAKKYRQERGSSEDKKDIPLMELRKRLRYRETRQTQNEETKVKDKECNDELSSDNSNSLPLFEYSDSDNEIDVNEVNSPQSFPEKEMQATVKPVKKETKLTGYVETFESLHVEIDLLTDTYKSVYENFNEYQSLSVDSERGKMSFIPIIGQLMSTLFGTVSESELDNINRNIKA